MTNIIKYIIYHRPKPLLKTKGTNHMKTQMKTQVHQH